MKRLHDRFPCCGKALGNTKLELGVERELDCGTAGCGPAKVGQVWMAELRPAEYVNEELVGQPVGVIEWRRAEVAA